MKILLLGKTGQVGWELQRSLAPLGEVIALDTRSTDYCGNLLDPDGLEKTIRTIKPQAIVNAAAYTAVDQAQSEQDSAMTINAISPGRIACTAQSIGAVMVHFSTDYVFDGSGEQAWIETDQPAPLNVYGASKLQGEKNIAASGAQHLIFRTSWVYAARGNNFAKTMLKLARERETLSVIDDQIGAPTGAELLADVTAQALPKLLADNQLSGLYHLSASGETSWYSYAQHVFKMARECGQTLKLNDQLFKAIPSSAYPTAAQRPLNSRLNCTKLTSTFGLNLPAWQTGIDRMLAETL